MIQPVANHILVEKIVKEPVSTGGFIMPEMHSDVEGATVIQVSESLKDKFTIGEVVLYRASRPIEVLDGQKTYLLLEDVNVLAKIK